MKNRKLFAGPYLFWSVSFIIIPLLMIFYYGLTDKEGTFTWSNIAMMASPENLKALGLALLLSLVSTLICLVLAYPLAMILSEKNMNQTSLIVLIFILPMWMNFLLRTLAWQPGVGQMLCCLKDAGYRLAVASSSPKPVITETLETLDLMKYFDVVTSGDEVKNPKPAPDTFLFAAKQSGVPVDECIVIEDSTNGGKAAKAAKMPCIWMHNPDSGDQEIPDAVLEITAWTKENIEKIMKFLHFDQEKVLK